jgi:hypothetical protein
MAKNGKPTGRTIAVYKSYNFLDKDPVIDKLRMIVQDSKKSNDQIHALSNVSVSTLRAWFEGQTKRPQFATVNAVGRALGYDLQFQPMPVGRKRG